MGSNGDENEKKVLTTFGEHGPWVRMTAVQ
jgi:hypothetical protein